MSDPKFDILMRRGPRWAWDELDDQIETLQALLKMCELLTDSDSLEDLNEALREIKKMGTDEPQQKIVPFEAESESESIITVEGKVTEEDKKQLIQNIEDSLKPPHLLKRQL